jgi:hypothetical protein
MTAINILKKYFPLNDESLVYVEEELYLAISKLHSKSTRQQLDGAMSIKMIDRLCLLSNKWNHQIVHLIRKGYSEIQSTNYVRRISIGKKIDKLSYIKVSPARNYKLEEKLMSMEKTEDIIGQIRNPEVDPVSSVNLIDTTIKSLGFEDKNKFIAYINTPSEEPQLPDLSNLIQQWRETLKSICVLSDVDRGRITTLSDKQLNFPDGPAEIMQSTDFNLSVTIEEVYPYVQNEQYAPTEELPPPPDEMPLMEKIKALDPAIKDVELVNQIQSEVMNFKTLLSDYYAEAFSRYNTKCMIIDNVAESINLWQVRATEIINANYSNVKNVLDSARDGIMHLMFYLNLSISDKALLDLVSRRFVSQFIMFGADNATALLNGCIHVINVESTGKMTKMLALVVDQYIAHMGL